MNLKRIFGAILTILGIVGLIYAAILFVNTSDGVRNFKILGIYGTLGLIFLFRESALCAPPKMNHKIKISRNFRA